MDEKIIREMIKDAPVKGYAIMECAFRQILKDYKTYIAAIILILPSILIYYWAVYQSDEIDMIVRNIGVSRNGEINVTLNFPQVMVTESEIFISGYAHNSGDMDKNIFVNLSLNDYVFTSGIINTFAKANTSFIIPVNLTGVPTGSNISLVSVYVEGEDTFFGSPARLQPSPQQISDNVGNYNWSQIDLDTYLDFINSNRIPPLPWGSGFMNNLPAEYSSMLYSYTSAFTILDINELPLMFQDEGEKIQVEEQILPVNITFSIPEILSTGELLIPVTINGTGNYIINITAYQNRVSTVSNIKTNVIEVVSQADIDTGIMGNNFNTTINMLVINDTLSSAFASEGNSLMFEINIENETMQTSRRAVFPVNVLPFDIYNIFSSWGIDNTSLSADRDIVMEIVSSFPRLLIEPDDTLVHYYINNKLIFKEGSNITDSLMSFNISLSTGNASVFKTLNTSLPSMSGDILLNYSFIRYSTSWDPYLGIARIPLNLTIQMGGGGINQVSGYVEDEIFYVGRGLAARITREMLENAPPEYNASVLNELADLVNGTAGESTFDIIEINTVYRSFTYGEVKIPEIISMIEDSSITIRIHNQASVGKTYVMELFPDFSTPVNTTAVYVPAGSVVYIESVVNHESVTVAGRQNITGMLFSYYGDVRDELSLGTGSGTQNNETELVKTLEGAFIVNTRVVEMSAAGYIGITYFLMIFVQFTMLFVLPLFSMVFGMQLMGRSMENRTMQVIKTKPVSSIELIIYRYIAFLTVLTIILFIPALINYLFLGFAIRGNELISSFGILGFCLLMTFLGLAVFLAVFNIAGLFSGAATRTKASLASLFYLVTAEFFFARTVLFLRRFTITHYIWSSGESLIGRYIDEPGRFIYIFGFTGGLAETPAVYALIILLSVVIVCIFAAYLIMTRRDTA